MAVSMDVIKRVVIQGSSEGLDKVEGELRKLTSTTDGVSVSFEKASRSQLSAEAAYKRLSASIDPADRAQQQITRSTSTLDRALKQGIITQDEYARRLVQVREKYSSAAAANDNMANSSKLARHELINLSRQVQDVGVSLYSGQPAMTVFIQQGSQIADVFASSKASLADFGRQVLGFVARNPFLVLAGGVAALGAGVLASASYLNNYVKVLDDLSRSSGIAAKDLSQLRESAAIKGIGNTDFASGMENFAAKIDEAKKGTNELGQLFRFNGKAISDNVTNLYTVADLVKNAADYQDKKNILEAAGLPITAEAVRYYSQGAEELKKQKEAAAGFGDDTKKLADNARAFDEAWNKAWESFKSYAFTSISESLAEIKKIASDPTVQAIIAFMSLTPEQAYGVWKGAVSRTIQRAKDWYNGTPAPSYNPGIPEGYEVVPPTQQYGPDLPKITQTVKALKEEIRVYQERISLLGESASAADKLALAEKKITLAIAEKIPLSDKDIAAIRANAVAVKEGATERESAWDKATNAMSRHMAQTQADIATIGQSVEAQTQLRNEVKLLEAAKESDIGVTQQQIDTYIKLRATMGEIQALKGAGISLDGGKLKTFLELPKADAKATETLKEQKKLYESLTNAASQFVTTIVEGFAKGEDLAKTLQNALASLGNQLISMGSKNLVGSLFQGVGADGQQTGGLLGGGLTDLLGLGGTALAGPIGGLLATGAGALLTTLFNDKNDEETAKQTQQLQEAQRVWKEAGPSFTRFINEMTGLGTGGDLSSKFQSVASNLKQIFKDAAAAYDFGAIAKAASASIHYQITQSQQFLATWNSAISGFQSGGGVLKATDAVKSELDRVLAFLDDTRTAMNILAGSSDFGATADLANAAGLQWVADGMNAAREAGKSYLLSLVDNKSAMSDVAKQLAEVTATADAVRAALVSLNVSAEDAAAAVNDRLASALREMASAFNTTLTEEINNLSGRGWANDASALLKDYQQKLADAALIGGDSDLVTRWFKLSAQNIVDGARLTGSAFNELITQFPELQGVVTAFVEAAKDAADRIKSYQDQLFIAQQDDQTLTGALAIFDLQAQREREQEIAAGGQALAALEALQAQKRLNIIEDFNKKALDEAQRAADEQKRVRDRELEEQKRAIEQTIEQNKRFVESLREFKESLALDSLSTLSPYQKLLEAQSQFRQTAVAAGTGDTAAQGRLESIARTYLSSARDYYGSGQGYTSIYQSVNATLDGVLSNAEAQLSDAQRQLEQLELQTNALNTIASNTAALVSLMSGGGAQEPSWVTQLPSIPGYADGTSFHAGGMALVGERGPEIVNLPRGSQVRPVSNNDNDHIAALLERIIDVLTATGRMNVTESARTANAVQNLSRRLSSKELSRIKAS